MDKFITTIEHRVINHTNFELPPLTIIDNITYTQDIISVQYSDVGKPYTVTKNMAAGALSKSIVDLMKHTKGYDPRTNTYYDKFSFTYAKHNEEDILRQRLEKREKHLAQTFDRAETLSTKLDKATKIIKYQWIALGVLSVLVLGVGLIC